jgi:hypothetical protein
MRDTKAKSRKVKVKNVQAEIRIIEELNIFSVIIWIYESRPPYWQDPFEEKPVSLQTCYEMKYLRPLLQYIR